MTYRHLLFVAASAATLLASAAAWAQTAAAGADTNVDELVVTGTRTEGRTRLESLAPVDVINEEALQRQGTTELAAALATLAPSLDFPRPAITDGTDSVRPAVLRGLQPDQTLVLINGMRGHTSALINVNTSVGRGSAAGSLVAYCLEITDLDPIHYDLLFERFLNPGRKSLPDMDLDFAV